MKKLSILVGALTLTSSLFAQDLTSKKGENFLPEQGDWAIGIDAVPFLNYFGNFIGGNGLNVAPMWNWTNDHQLIVGKYFVEEKMAYRGALRIGFGSNSGNEMVADRAADNTFVTFPTVQAQKENTWKISNNAIGLAGGLEWRKGNTRLQGFYGGELGFMMSGVKETYTYGNALNPTAPTNPVFIDADDDMAVDTDGDGFTDYDNAATDSYGNTARQTEEKSSSFGLGLRGFIGVEYFVIPKLSVGGEFGWGLGFMTMKSSSELEGIGDDLAGNPVVGKQSMEGAKMSTFGIDTDINNTVFGRMGQLKITFHF